MSRAAALATAELAKLLRGDAGLPAAIAALQASSDHQLPPLTEVEILEGNIPADLFEKSARVKYPSVHLFCEKVLNKLRERFKTFSGTAALAVDVRVTHDHICDLHQQLHLCVQGVTDVLDQNRGSWTTGVFYTGGYEVCFQPVKRGGKNFIQSARVQLELHVSID